VIILGHSIPDDESNLENPSEGAREEFESRQNSPVKTVVEQECEEQSQQK